MYSHDLSQVSREDVSGEGDVDYQVSSEDVSDEGDVDYQDRPWAFNKQLGPTGKEMECINKEESEAHKRDEESHSSWAVEETMGEQWAEKGAVGEQTGCTNEEENGAQDERDEESHSSWDVEKRVGVQRAGHEVTGKKRVQKKVIRRLHDSDAQEDVRMQRRTRRKNVKRRMERMKILKNAVINYNLALVRKKKYKRINKLDQEVDKDLPSEAAAEPSITDEDIQNVNKLHRRILPIEREDDKEKEDAETRIMNETRVTLNVGKELGLISSDNEGEIMEKMHEMVEKEVREWELDNNS